MSGKRESDEAKRARSSSPAGDVDTKHARRGEPAPDNAVGLPVPGDFSVDCLDLSSPGVVEVDFLSRAYFCLQPGVL